MDITPIFPQLLFSCTIPVPEGLIEYCSILKEGKKEYRSLFGGWETPNDLYRNEDFVNKFLKPYFLPKFNDELRSIKFPKWKFNSCWIAQLHRNGYHVSHIHANTDIAFVWYLKISENKGGHLSIRNPYEYQSHNLISNLDEKINQELNLYPAFNIAPREGLLLMFPAYLYHSVLPSTADNRIAMSGNILIVNN